jgi:hypothetical protein
MNRWRPSLLCVPLAAFAWAATGAEPSSPTEELKSLRDDLREVRAMVQQVQGELRSAQRALGPQQVARFEEWRSLRDARRADVSAVERLRAQVDQERSEIQRLMAFQRNLQPPPPKPGEPIELAIPDRPRFAPRYTPPLAPTYLGYGGYFDTYGTYPYYFRDPFLYPYYGIPSAPVLFPGTTIHLQIGHQPQSPKPPGIGTPPVPEATGGGPAKINDAVHTADPKRGRDRDRGK